MGKVKDRILKEAKENKKKIEKQSKSRAKKIKEEAKKEAEEIKEAGKEKAKEEEKQEMERILSKVRMDLSARKLEKKNEIVNGLKEKVLKKMKKLKWKGEYKPFIQELILSASKDGDEEILVGSLHDKKAKDLIKSLNKKKKKYKFTISKEKPDFEVGVILSKGKKKINATLPVLLEEKFDEMQEEIVSTLFGSE